MGFCYDTTLRYFKRQNIKQIIIKLLLLFYLFTSYVNATHFHHEEVDVDNCQICIVLKVFHSADLSSSDIHFIFPDLFYITSYFGKSSNVALCHKGYYATAPPSFS